MKQVIVLSSDDDQSNDECIGKTNKNSNRNTTNISDSSDDSNEDIHLKPLSLVFNKKKIRHSLANYDLSTSKLSTNKDFVSVSDLVTQKLVKDKHQAAAQDLISIWSPLLYQRYFHISIENETLAQKAYPVSTWQIRIGNQNHMNGLWFMRKRNEKFQFAPWICIIWTATEWLCALAGLLPEPKGKIYDENDENDEKKGINVDENRIDYEFNAESLVNDHLTQHGSLSADNWCFYHEKLITLMKSNYSELQDENITVIYIIQGLSHLLKDYEKKRNAQFRANVQQVPTRSISSQAFLPDQHSLRCLEMRFYCKSLNARMIHLNKEDQVRFHMNEICRQVAYLPHLGNKGYQVQGPKHRDFSSVITLLSHVMPSHAEAITSLFPTPRLLWEAIRKTGKENVVLQLASVEMKSKSGAIRKVGMSVAQKVVGLISETDPNVSCY